ncbi:GNAT family N-acetyltransferase [Halarchaeum sp. P4]|uniref:GNAT family N-acetyltransferase n=1 Tax=Halarchaeum sp. P4 TaxID=3421639 RepID=UPI003EC12D5B
MSKSNPTTENDGQSSTTSESTGAFRTSVTDNRGRTLDITGHRGHLATGVVDDLTEMYNEFGHEDRAQGLPPLDTDGIRSWLERLGEFDASHLVVRHDDTPAAHAVLVPDDDHAGDACELAIFVHPDYQGARVGTHTMRELFDYGRENDVETVWLHVEKSNAPAVSLYERYDFEVITERPLEFEMRRDLAGGA